MNKETEISDRNLIRVRLRFLDLLKSFFQEEPDAEKMSRWRGIFAALAKERINPQLDAAVAQLDEILEKKELQDLKDEYYALFIDPYSREKLPLHASYYLEGRGYGQFLVDYREFLKNGQLIVDSSNTDPEDTLPLMLDTLVFIIEEEKNGSLQARVQQNELVEQFLLPAVQQLAAAVIENSKADFYQYCILFLNQYLELEQGILEAPDIDQ